MFVRRTALKFCAFANFASAPIDRATFADPLIPPAGIELVFVGGKPVLRDGVILDRRAGKSVRG